MGRFARTHPEEHRRAVVEAVLDDGMAHTTAIAKAAAGELPCCGPFSVSTGTVSNWVTAERRRRQPNIEKVVVEQGPEEMVAAVRRRLASMLERDLVKAEALPRRDPRELERFASAADRIGRMGKGNSNGNGKAQGEDNEQDEGPSPLVETLTSAASTNTGTRTDSERGPSTTPHARDPAPAQAA